jgi:hypothetical protein
LPGQLAAAGNAVKAIAGSAIASKAKDALFSMGKPFWIIELRKMQTSGCARADQAAPASRAGVVLGFLR